MGPFYVKLELKKKIIWLTRVKEKMFMINSACVISAYR